MEESIKTKAELFSRIKPAIDVKIKDIKRDYKINITSIEIFEYLEDKVWRNKVNLSLSEIVEDVFSLDVNYLFSDVEKRRQDEKNQR